MRRSDRRILSALVASGAFCVLHPWLVALTFTEYPLDSMWASDSRPPLLVYEAPIDDSAGPMSILSQLRLLPNSAARPSYGITILTDELRLSLRTGVGFRPSELSETSAIASWTPSKSLLQSHTNQRVQTAGYSWPFVSAASDYDDSWTTTSNSGSMVSGLPLNGIELSGASTIAIARDRLPRSLPTRPVWIGLTGDLVVAWLAAFLASFPIQIVGRAITGKRRGWSWDVCPGCGYRVKGLSTCPECGAVRPHKQPTPRQPA